MYNLWPENVESLDFSARKKRLRLQEEFGRTRAYMRLPYGIYSTSAERERGRCVSYERANRAGLVGVGSALAVARRAAGESRTSGGRARRENEEVK